MRPDTRRTPEQPFVSASGGTSVPPFVILVGVLAWALFRIGTGIVLEDALITFRFAENLAHGQGFAFNPGERVLGTTTPLFTLVLAGLGAVFGTARIPLLACVVSLAAAAAGAWFLIATLRAWGLSDRVAALAGFAFVLHPDVLWSTVGGMETALVLLWMALSLWALATRRWVLASAAAALLVLTRPDGLIWALAVLGALVVERRSAVRRELGVFALVLLPWIVFATLYFGSPIPQSLIAKSAGSAQAGRWVLLRPETMKEALDYFAGWLPFPPGKGLALAACGLGLALLGFGIARLRSLGLTPAMRVLIGFSVAFAIAYYLGRAPHAFPWYGLPVTWAWLVLCAIGLGTLFERARSRQRALALVPVAVAAILAIAWVREIARTYRYEKEFQANEITTRKAIGLWLDRNAAKDATVAMEAIGYQGTYAHRRVIDLAGLVSPRVTALTQEGPTPARAFGRIVQELAPDYIVLRSFEVDRNRNRNGGPFFETARAESVFHRSYSDRLRVTAPYEAIWGGGARLTVYAKRATMERQ